MNRRTLLATLVSLPFCGWLKPSAVACRKEMLRTTCELTSWYPVAGRNKLVNASDAEWRDACDRMAKSLDEEMKRKFG